MTRRALLTASLALVLLAGCGADRRGVGQGGFVLGETLGVYVTLPAGGEPAAADMVDAVKLALAESEGRAGAYKVNMAVLDSSAAGGGTDRDKALANARQALRDPSAVAVIGEISSAATMRAAPLMNAAGVLYLSPGAGYAGLSTSRRAQPGEPERYQPAGPKEPNYARLVPSDLDIVPALLRAAGPGRVVVSSDATDAGLALAAALRARLGARLTADARRADAVIYAGEDSVTGAGELRAAARANPRARLVGTDALALDRQRLRGLRRVRLVSKAPPLDAGFAGRFQARFHRRPDPHAAIAYEAMRLVLDGIGRLGAQANVRPRLNAAILRERRHGTLLGDYAFDRNGDTTRRATTIVRP